jgi:hypothetical protein
MGGPRRRYAARDQDALIPAMFHTERFDEAVPRHTPPTEFQSGRLLRIDVSVSIESSTRSAGARRCP